jgi:hypothetical protein
LNKAEAATLGHEAFHATDKDNISQTAGNLYRGENNDREAKPEEVETAILKEMTKPTKQE